MNKPRHGIGRRALSWPLTLLVYFIVSMVLAAPAEGATFRDEFDAIAYNGNNGSSTWTGDWIESGEADGPGTGFLRVVSDGNCTAGNCFRLGIDGNNSNTYLWREADLSGATTATLTYDLVIDQADKGFVHVEIQVGGGGWANLATYDLNAPEGAGCQKFDMTPWIGSDTQVRFRGTNEDDDPGSSKKFVGFLYFDNIEILTDAAAAACTDLVVVKTDSADPVFVNTNFTYALTITNNGPDASNNVTVVDALPASVAYQSATPSQGGCVHGGEPFGGTVTCNLGTIANGANATVNIIVDSSTTLGRITNEASVSGDEPDFSAGNSDKENTDIVGTCPGGLVTTTLDSALSGSLRACIIWSNTTGGTQTLDVPAGIYTLTVTRTGENNAVTGDLDITDDIIINGSAAGATIIDGNAIDRVFEIRGSATMTASNLTIRNGDENDGGGIRIEKSGASLILSSSTISGNHANKKGGGIFNKEGTLTLTNVTISGNTANERGGGLHCEQGDCTLTNVTVTGNSASIEGDGIREKGGATVTFLNTIVANNGGGGDNCSGSATNFVSNGNNLSSDATCDFTASGDQQNTDPLLGPLQDNGGPTFTHDLLTGSTAIEGGTNTGCPATDQRGIARPVGTTCDIGAVEAAAGDADLALTKTDSADPVPVSTPFTYTLTATNNGPASASNVTLVDTLPVDVAFQLATPSQGSCVHSGEPLGGTVTCTLGTIANGANATVDIDIDSPITVGGINNSATVSADETDPVPADNTANEPTDIVVNQANLRVIKVDDLDPNGVNLPVIYTVTVTNQGPGAATGVTLVDTLDAASTYVSAVPSQGSCLEAAGVITCDLLGLANGISATVVITATAPGTPQTITNTAVVSATEPDFDLSDNTVLEDTVITNPPPTDLQLTKTDSPDPVVEGNTLTYTLTVTNLGPGPATNVLVVDTLPPTATYVSATPSTGSCNPPSPTVDCDLGTLSNGAVETIVIVVTAPLGAGVITNNAVVSTTRVDPVAANNSASADTTVTVPGGADISLSKSDSPDPVNVTQTLSYTLTVDNLGPDPATDVILVDVLPATVAYQSVVPSQGSCIHSGEPLGGTVTCTMGTIANAANASATIFVTAPVSTGTITNNASISTSAIDGNPANDTASEDTTVQNLNINQLCYLVADAGGGGGGNDLLTRIDTADFDPVTNETNIGIGTGTNRIEAIAWNSATSTLYAADAGQLGILNTTTGVFAASPSPFGTGNGALGAITFTDVDGLAYDATTGVLFGIEAEGGTDVMIQINMATGAHVPDAFGVGIDYVPIPPVLGNDRTDDIAVDPITGIMYAAVNAGGSTDRLININKLTGATTDIALITVPDIEGLGTDVTGQLWGTSGTQGILYEISKTTGVGSNGCTIDNGSDYEAVDCDQLSPVVVADLAVTKGVNDATPNELDTITYSVSVTNNGPANATVVQIADPLPAGVTYVSDTPTQGSYDSFTGNWFVGSLAVSATATLTIQATVDAGTAGSTITNTASVSFLSQSDPNSSNDIDSVDIDPVTVCPAGIVLTTADTGPSSLRECINYANGIPGTTITFNIPGPGNRSAGADSWWEISPATPLPTVTAAGTVIDATTQTTNQGDTNSRGPEVEIDGTGAGAGANGLVLDVTAAASTIRGLAIGNFSDNGILLLGGSNIIAGNYLGLSADGDTAVANNPGAASSLGGIRIESASNTIGGVAAADRNVISGNGFAGIEIFGAGAFGNMVFGNFIGVDATGTLARPNSQEGVDIDLSDGNIIGGPLPGQRNIISGNASDGIEIDGGDFNFIQGNYIGTDLTGTVLIPNGRDGIDLNDNLGDGAQNNLIGGTGANEGNLIRGNTLYGISVRDATVINNSILGNQIYENILLDIDLNDDGITANDALDADAGSNDLLNFPVIVAAPESGGIITAYFGLDVPAGDYRVEFFSNPPGGAHGSGNGGGEVFVSATTITHAGAGIEYFVFAFAGSALDVITSTATEELAGPTYNSTSEFSAAFTATAFTPFSARWPLDETSGVIAVDVDAGNNGTYQNGVLLDQLAACSDTGNAVYFDGVDDIVEVPHSADYLIDEGTVSFWAQADAFGTVQGLFSKDSTDLDTGGHLTIRLTAGGNVEVRLQSTTTSMTITGAAVSAGTWFHVAFSWGPAGMALYVDGAAPVTDPYIGGLGVTSGGIGNFEPIAFGAQTVVSADLLVTPTTEFFAGYMDDVRINNRALTLPEIQTLATCNPNLIIIKRAFQTDGTPIPTGSIVPDYLEFKYLLYINNSGGARTDISVRDVLDPAFQYQLESMQVDNSVAECAAAICDAAEELAIFTAINGAPVLTDALGDDVVSYAAATIDAGNGNVGNLQLDINADSVWAILFSVKMP